MQITRFVDVALSSGAKAKVLRCLVLDSRPRSGRSLARDAGVSQAQARLVLRDLHGDGIVRLDRVGRAYVYSLRREALPVRELLIPLFEKERGLADAIASQIAQAVQTPIVSIGLFGSVARGADDAESDFDLAFVVRGPAEERSIQDELAGDVADKAMSLGVTLGPYVITGEELRRRYHARDPFARELVMTARPIAGQPLLEVVLFGRSKTEDTKGRSR